MSSKLYSDDKDIEKLEQEAFVDTDKVIFNLYEDILCLKEELQQAYEELDIAVDIIEQSGVCYEELRDLYEQNNS